MPLPRFPSSLLGHPWRWTLLTAKTLAFVHCFVTYGYSLGPAYGPSMLPTFEVLSEWLLISKRHRYGRALSVGDLVVYKIPIEPQADGIKRVLGLPGDYVLINSPESERDTMIQVPEGHCWLVGDNLPASRDSRTFGPVPMGLIRGKVIAKTWPLWDFKWIVNPMMPPPKT